MSSKGKAVSDSPKVAKAKPAASDKKHGPQAFIVKPKKLPKVRASARCTRRSALYCLPHCPAARSLSGRVSIPPLSARLCIAWSSMRMPALSSARFHLVCQPTWALPHAHRRGGPARRKPRRPAPLTPRGR